MALFFPLLVFSQTEIHGKVSNTDKEPVSSASVIVKDTVNTILAYTYSNDKGNYSLEIKTSGKFKLTFSSLGYQSQTVDLNIQKDQKKIEFNIVLEISSKQLDVVNIKTESPISIRKDTIAIKTKFFTNGTEETVEDLLKKIPGLQIDSEGNIKVGNTEIEKLMVDGDDFFGKGYKILSKNMPAHPIEEVDILKHYSNNKLLKGVEQSEKVALNLKLDEKAKRIWFGNIEAGGGNNHFYEAKGNLMNFGKKNKYYFLGNLDNTGNNITGDVSSLVNSGNLGDPVNLGRGEQAHNLLGLPSGSTRLGKNRSNFNNDKLLSLNAIFNPTEKLKIKPLFFSDWEDHDFFRKHQKMVNVEGADFTNTEDYQLHHKNRIAFGKLDMHYDISKTQMLETSMRYDNGQNNGGSQLVFNGNSTREGLKNHNTLFDQKINYTNKFKDKKVMMLTGRFIDNKSPENYSLNQFYYQDLFPDLKNADNVKQHSSDHMQYVGVNAHYFNRMKGGNLLELQLGNEYHSDKLDSHFSVFDGGDLLDNPDGFQNRTHYTVNDLYFKTKYLVKIGNFGFGGRLDFHQLFNSLKTGSVSTRQDPFFVNPQISANWEINTKNKLSTSYSYNKTNAGILDVYDKYVLTGFRSFAKGTGTFNQLSASSFNLAYRLGNWSDRFFGNVTFMYNKNHDFFSTNSVIQKDFAQSEKILIKGPETTGGNAQANYYFKSISTNLKLKLGYSKSHFKNIVNGSAFRRITSENYDYGFELRSVFDGIFNYNIGAKWMTNQIKTGIKSSYTNNKSFLDLVFKLNDRFNAKIKSDFYHFGSLQTHKAYYFLDLEARYKLIPKKLTLGLTGKNLFNTKKFRTYSISDIGFSTTEYRLLPRMVLLKVKFRF